MLIGTITNWNQQSAFGFIERDDGDRDVFLHVSGFAERIAPQSNPEGSRVEFEIAINPRSGKPCATNARLLDAHRS